MLEYLHIRNLALIEDMELDFTQGINALTGETGAGKSFILKALGFLLGDRLGADMVRPGAERAQVEASFKLDGQELVLRRDLAAASGRGRFYVNDSLAGQDKIRQLRERLLSHTSQHAQQELLQPAYQAKLLENDFPSPELLKQRDAALAKLKSISEQINVLHEKQDALAEKRELLEMQKEEIDKVSPYEGEEEELERKRAEAKSREGAKVNYNRAMAILYGEDNPGLLQLLGDFGRLLSHMAKNDEALNEEAANVEAFRQQIAALANQFKRPPVSEKINMDDLEERLFTLAQLKRKLKRSLPQILQLKDEIKENLSFLDVCALDLSRLNKEQARLAAELKKLISQIAPLRRRAAEQFAKKLEEQLRDLGFSEHVRVMPEFVEQEIWPDVKDERGIILWAPNPGQKPRPLDKIASGGELSRFLLALNTLKRDSGDQTYIFDEVDAGVGGLTLNKVGEKLLDFAREHQVILITHWPQLAARAQKHFQILKIIKDGNTYTMCSPLEGKSREDELARMAGGGMEGRSLAENLL